MDIGDHRLADLAVHAVDAADRLLDPRPHDLVLLDALAAWRGQLQERHLGGVEPTFLDELLECTKTHVDALGVVQSVHAQHEHARGAQLFAQAGGAGEGLALACERVDGSGVDGDGERTGAHRAVVCADLGGFGLVGTQPYRGETTELVGEDAEIIRAAGQVEAHEVGAEHALDQLGAPRQLHEQLDGRERDVEEEPDCEVRPQLAEEPGDQQ